MPIAADYVSPMLRKAIFDQLWPGSEISYTVIPLNDGFPVEFHDSPGKPIGAIRCEIVRPDGSYAVGFREIDTMEQGKDKKWRDRPLTPEAFVVDCTKAMGRCLRDAGIPQKKGELQVLMNFVAALRGVARPGKPAVDASAIEGNVNADDIDSPDAGSSDEMTEEQQVAVAVAALEGPQKAELAAWARTEHGVTNLMRSGEHAPTIAAALQRMERGESMEPEF